MRADTGPKHPDTAEVGVNAKVDLTAEVGVNAKVDMMEDLDPRDFGLVSTTSPTRIRHPATSQESACRTSPRCWIRLPSLCLSSPNVLKT